MTIHKKFLNVAGAILLAGTMALNATEDKKEQEKHAETAAAVAEAGKKAQAESAVLPIELVKKAYAYIGNLKQYSFEAKIVNEDDLDGEMMIYLTHHYKVSVIRPDKVRMDVRGDVENRNTYFDNGKVSIIDIDDETYGEVQVSADIDEALDDLTEKYGIAIPLTQLLYSDTDENMDDLKDGDYFGTVLVDGAPCYYVGFPGRDWDIQVWVEKGDKPLIRRAAFVDKRKKGQPRSMISVKWNLDGAIDENMFVFKAPKDAIKAKVFTLEEAKNLKIKYDADSKDVK